MVELNTCNIYLRVLHVLLDLEKLLTIIFVGMPQTHAFDDNGEEYEAIWDYSQLHYKENSVGFWLFMRSDVTMLAGRNQMSSKVRFN